MYKEIFEALLDSKKDHNVAWDCFRRERIKINEETLQHLPTDSPHYSTLAECLRSKKDGAAIDSLLEDDDLWKSLLFAVRDQTVKGLDLSKQEPIQVLSSGVTFSKTLSELEESVLEDYGDIYNTQIAIPDGVIFTEDKGYLKQKLKTEFDSHMKCQCSSYLMRKPGAHKCSKCLPDDNQRQLIKKINDSCDAKHLQNIIAAEAEVFIQDTIIEAARSGGLPVTVMRGVQTYKDVGKHLERYGIELSKLNEILKEKDGKEKEAEHDVMVLAMNGDNLIITFIQV